MMNIKYTLRRIKTWWDHSLYGYSELKKDESVQHIYSSLGIENKPFYVHHPPKLWGMVIAWFIKLRLFQKLFTLVGAAIVLFITTGPDWFPDIPERLKPIALSVINRFFAPSPPEQQVDNDKTQPSSQQSVVVTSQPSAVKQTSSPNTSTHNPPPNK